MNKLVFIRFVLALALGSTAMVGAQSTYLSSETYTADDIIGVWQNSDNVMHVKIERVGTHYYGKLIWLEKPLEPDGTPKLDKHNPDPKLRKVPFIGLRVLKDMKYKGNGVWNGGTIYDPEKGKTYGCRITMKNKNEADIRGFIGLRLLGKTERFSRVEN